MTFEDDFPTLKDNDYCEFNQIQKDKLQAVCLDKQKVLDIINSKLSETSQTNNNAQVMLRDLKEELNL